MRSLFRWASVGVVLATSAITALAQQAQPIQPNYIRQSNAPWNQGLPGPDATIGASTGSSVVTGSASTLGTSIQNGAAQGAPMTIPQQGNVDLGSAASYSGTCADGSCGPDCGHGGLGCLDWLHNHGSCCGWFGGIYYLNLWRDDENFNLPLATSVANPAVTVLDAGDARMKNSDGGGIRIGKMLNACWAVEGVYWQVDPSDGYCEHTASGLGSNINTSILFNDLTYDNLLGGGPVPVDNFFQNTSFLSLRRTFDYRNFEVNFLRMPFTYAGGGCGRARIALLGGVRYFEGDESFTLFSDLNNEIPGDDPTNELHYLNEVENHLVGFQFGGILDYCISPRFSAQLGTKFGIYNNHMRQVQAVASGPGGGGGAVIGGAGPDAGQPFGLINKKDDVAFLTELDAGVAYNINCNWRLSGGYKVLAISGYADSVNQIPYDWSSIRSVAVIQDNNSLILHGIYAGVEYAW